MKPEPENVEERDVRNSTTEFRIPEKRGGWTNYMCVFTRLFVCGHIPWLYVCDVSEVPAHLVLFYGICTSICVVRFLSPNSQHSFMFCYLVRMDLCDQKKLAQSGVYLFGHQRSFLSPPPSPSLKDIPFPIVLFLHFSVSVTTFPSSLPNFISYLGSLIVMDRICLTFSLSFFVYHFPTKRIHLDNKTTNKDALRCVGRGLNQNP